MTTPSGTTSAASVGILAVVLTLIAVGVALSDARAFTGRHAPELTGTRWINSRPLSIQDLRGSVVLVEFWTFGCVNCRNVEPQVRAWHRRYATDGLVVVGVHTPEFAYERDAAAVARYAAEHDLQYPVVMDNSYAIWNRYSNRYWPAMYLIDKGGVIRYVRVGEGGYDETERMIRLLLDESATPPADRQRHLTPTEDSNE